MQSEKRVIGSVRASDQVANSYLIEDLNGNVAHTIANLLRNAAFRFGVQRGEQLRLDVMLQLRAELRPELIVACHHLLFQSSCM